MRFPWEESIYINIDIAADIGTVSFGTFLLDDNNGKKSKKIEKSELGDPVDTAVAILQVHNGLREKEESQ